MTQANETTNTTTTESVTAAAWELTKAQSDNVKMLDGVIDKVREIDGSNPLKAAKALEAFARDYQGATNEAKRITMISGLLEIDPKNLIPTKAGVVALATCLSLRYMGTDVEQIREEVKTIIRKEKEAKTDEPSAGETALATVFGGNQAIVASDAVKSLSVDDLNNVNAAAHSAFQTAINRLQTKENPIPRQAVDFVSFLIGASGGSTGHFELTDGFIVQAMGVSPSTVARGRRALIEWMQASGKGIVEIKQGEGKAPTIYRVNLLEATTRIMHNLINSANADSEALLVVSALTGKLLTEGTEKLQATVSPEQFAQAQAMDVAISEAVDSMPAPAIVTSTQAKTRQRDTIEKKFDTLTEKLGKMQEGADELEMKAVAKDVKKLQQDTRAAYKAFAENTAMVDFDFTDLQTRFDAIEKAVQDASKSAIDLAREKAAEAKTGKTPQTPRQIAEGYVESLPTSEAIEDERVNRLDDVREGLAFLAVIAERSEVVGAVDTAYDEAIALVNEAFGK